VAQPRKTVSIRGKKTATAIAKPGPRTTKQELVLTLLSRKDGPTIEKLWPRPVGSSIACVAFGGDREEEARL
jgi:hypothetical protein